MNRWEKEKAYQRAAARDGKTEQEVALLDAYEEMEARIQEESRHLHIELFEEEYDYMYDSAFDRDERAHGVTPMKAEYVKTVNAKRVGLGFRPLNSSGMPHEDDDTHSYCYKLAMARISADLSKPLPPAVACAICGKSLEEVGGRRISTTQLRGVFRSAEDQGEGKKGVTSRSISLNDTKTSFLTLRGGEDMWTEKAVGCALETVHSCRSPWLCQKCTGYTCKECGEPVNFPAGANILYLNETLHCPMFPVNLGCINKECRCYKKSEFPRA